MVNLASIGDVLVVDGDTDNPYTASRIEGPVRAVLLERFRASSNCGTATFWHGPTSGGARRITGPNEVDWAGMSA